MNQKQLSFLLGLVVVIGGIGLYLFKQNNASWQTSSQESRDKLLANFPLNDVAQIAIKQGTNQVALAKDAEAWKVRERYDYPANFSEIQELLRKLWELKGVQKVKLGASQLGRLELLAPGAGTNGGTLLEFKDKNGKLVSSLLLGKKHLRQQAESNPNPMMGDAGGWPDGRFVLASSSNSAAGPNVWVVAEPFSNVEPKPESWLNREFLKVEKIKAVSVRGPQATNDWKLERETETGEMKLADKKEGEELDASKIYGVNNLFSSVNISDVVSPNADPKTLGLDQPTTATVLTFDNFTYTIQIGGKTNEENFPVRVSVAAELATERAPGKDEKAEDKAKLDKEFKEKLEKLREKLKKEQTYEKWTFLLSKWNVEALLKPRAELMAAKKDAAKAGATPPAGLPADMVIPGAEADKEEGAKADAPGIPPLPAKE